MIVHPLCGECGHPVVVQDDGSTNHLILHSVGFDHIDHDMDAQHTAWLKDEDVVFPQPQRLAA